MSAKPRSLKQISRTELETRIARNIRTLPVTAEVMQELAALLAERTRRNSR